MNTKAKLFLPAALAVAFGLANWSANAAALLPDVVPTASATRTVVITPSTKWINATDMETVEFDSNGHQFAVDFDGLSSNFSLNAVAPAGALDHPVRAYVHAAPGDNAGG